MDMYKKNFTDCFMYHLHGGLDLSNNVTIFCLQTLYCTYTGRLDNSLHFKKCSSEKGGINAYTVMCLIEEKCNRLTKSKEEENRRLFDIFDKEFIDQHCRKSIIDWWIKMALSACRCRAQVVTDKVTLSMKQIKSVV